MLHFITEAFRGLNHARLMSVISIFTIALSLTFLALLMVAYLNVHHWMQRVSREVDMVVYIQDDTTSTHDTSLTALIDSVRSLPRISKCVYVDKRTALQRFRRMYGDEMLSAVYENPLPASLELFIHPQYETPGDMKDLSSVLERFPLVDGVTYYAAITEKFAAVKRYVLYGAIGIFVFMAIALNFIISNTIKLTIYARKELLRNMYFVGATPGYIKAPFIIEGILHGFIGACISAFIMVTIRVALAGFPVVWQFEQTVPLIFLTGVFFGCLGSFSAVQKFLE
jgi:cell division transport system permease protein